MTPPIKHVLSPEKKRKGKNFPAERRGGAAVRIPQGKKKKKRYVDQGHCRKKKKSLLLESPYKIGKKGRRGNGREEKRR